MTSKGNGKSSAFEQMKESLRKAEGFSSAFDKSAPISKEMIKNKKPQSFRSMPSTDSKEAKISIGNNKKILAE